MAKRADIRRQVLEELKVPEVYRRPVGRPPMPYSPEIAEALCADLALHKTVAAFCEKPGMPSEWTIYKWLREVPEFTQLYARAREDAVFKLIDELIEIADRDDLEPRDKAVRIATRQWVASKHAPKVYGDAVAKIPPPPELLAMDQEKRRDLRQSLLRELSDLAKPEPLVIDQEGREP